MDNNLLLGEMMGLLLKKIIVPQSYSGQVAAIQQMLSDDVSGLVCSLVDFLIESSSVDFSIETQNSSLNQLFQDWLDGINLDYNGTVPIGITELAREYYKERWQNSSFPILKIAKWAKIAGTDFIFPVKMYFVEGSSIRAIDKDDSNDLTLNSYDYYIGDTQKPETKLEKDVIITRPFGRWTEKFPTPYLIRRGVFHNFKIIQSLKNKETEILDSIIPYLLLIKKGTADLFRDSQKSYSQPELQQILQDFQNLLSDYKNTNIGDKNIKTPARAVNFDEEITQLIPDLKTIFDPILFQSAERNILSGLGYIDVIQGVSSTRKESVLNPAAFLQEIQSGVEGFKGIIKQLIFLIKDKNFSHIKYNANTLYVCNSPIKAFQTDTFRDKIRGLYDRGLVSKRTAVELIGNVDYNTEGFRREKESLSGADYIFYPPIITNTEDKGIDTQGLNPNPTTPEKITKENIPPDKKGIEKKNYTNAMEEINEDLVMSSILEEDELEISFKPRVTEKYIRLRQVDPKQFDSKSFKTINIDVDAGIKAIIGKIKGETTTTIQSLLFVKEKFTVKEAQEWVTKHKQVHAEELSKVELITAPYKTLTDLPPAVKEKLSIPQQKAWLKIWNRAFMYMMGKSGGNREASETYAFRTAWSKARQINKSDKTFLQSIKDFFRKK